MIYITERAKQELKRLLDTKVNWPGARLRFMDRGQGRFGLGIDIEKPDDIVMEFEGAKLMVIEPRLATDIKHFMLDVDDTPGGPELVIIEEVTKQWSATDAVDWMPLSPASFCDN